MNKENLKSIKKVEYITHAIDGVFLLAYLLLFIYLFKQIIVPDTPPVQETIYNYVIFGFDMNSKDLNFILSILMIFMAINLPLLFIGLKNTKNKDFYEYDRWYAINFYVKAIISLLSMNPFGLVLKWQIGKKIFTKLGYKSLLEGSKSLVNEFKEKQAKIKENKESDESDLQKTIRKQTWGTITRIFFTYLFLSLLALFTFIPFYWMVLTALKTYEESNLADVPKIFMSLRDFQWMNFRYVLQEVDFGRFIVNTLFVGVISTIGTLLTTILAAFAFARLDFKGRETIFSILLMTMMIPGELYIITNFLTVSQAGIGWVGGLAGTNNYWLAMIVPFMTSVFYIFFLRQTFKQIPDSLYRAAKVDGSSDFKYLTRVMIPIAGPTLFTITILSVIGSWNAFMWPRLITSVGDVNEGKLFWLISVALRDADFTTGGVNARPMYNMQIAASALVTIPLIVVFLALRKYIVSGVGRSGTKG